MKVVVDVFVFNTLQVNQITAEITVYTLKYNQRSSEPFFMDTRLFAAFLDLR